MSMKTNSKLCALGSAAALSLILTACGNNSEDSDAASAMQQSGSTTGVPMGTAAPKVAAPTLAEGPDVCFKAIAKHIGASTKVSEITSFFSSGKEIDTSSTEPQGQLTTCSVQYQRPASISRPASSTSQLRWRSA
jgi:hypothetical protein